MLTERVNCIHGNERLEGMNMDGSWVNAQRDEEGQNMGQQRMDEDVPNSGQLLVDASVPNSGQQAVLEAQTIDASIGEICERGRTPEYVDWFDPISSIELISSQPLISITLGSNENNSQRRPRGRPKRNANSLPEPLYIQSTPSPRQQEAVKTWNSGKTVGVRSRKEKEVISQLRKSRRLMLLEDGRPTA